ncbi:MAG TPA: hypothetical protein EYG92_11485, partial [Lutibacter sp.]|nr:hypothetical protein [Lutibacter sp.]
MNINPLKVKYNLTFVILLFITISNAQSFVIDFPEQAESPNVCYSQNALLKVRLDVAKNSIDGATVIINLPDGVEYIIGSVIKTGGTNNFTITENGGTSSAPEFIIGPSILNIGEHIEFTIERTANCQARTNAINELDFEDSVSATIDGETTTNTTEYTVSYPSVSFTQPEILINTLPNSTYTRTFSITNGAEGCLETIYFSVDYGNITFNSLDLNGVSIVPVSSSGSINYYEISGDLLPSNQELCYGEELNFIETITVGDCSVDYDTTQYQIGWGCNQDPAQWCQTEIGYGAFALNNASASLSFHSQNKVGFTDMCTPFEIETKLRNGGNGEVKAVTMYDLVIKKGRIYSPIIYSYDQRFILGDTKIGDVTLTGSIISGIYVVNIANDSALLNHDPDGAGFGLDDIDGDNYFDDLPPNTDLTLLTEMSFSCMGSCTLSIHNYLFGTAIYYKNMCGDSTVKMSSSNNRNIEFIETGFGDVGHIPSNIYEGTTFNVRLAAAKHRKDNAYASVDTRIQYVLTLAPGVTADLSSVEWHLGEYPSNIDTTTAGFIVTQTGNTVTITSPAPTSNNNAYNFFGWTTIDLEYDCSNGEDLTMDWKLLEINDATINADNSVTSNCECFSEILCGEINVLAHCLKPCSEGISVSEPIITRAENSLGWTDSSMTTKVDPANISTYDLSKALYLDEIEIRSNATLNGADSDNFFIRTVFNRINNVTIYQPLSVDVTIIRNGAVIVPNTTISSFSEANSTDSLQIIDWNLTAMLPNGEILDGDQVYTISRYQVKTNNIPKKDEQTGSDFFMYYNDSSGNMVYCNHYIPQTYVAGTGSLVATNPHRVNGCNTTSLGGGSNYMARRFNASGLKYQNEFRPGMLINSFTIDVPSGYDLESVSYHVIDGYANPYGSNTQLLTPSSIITNPDNSSTVTFLNDDPNNPGTPLWPAMNITVTNNYGAAIPTRVIAKCNTEEIESISREFFITDFYYHYVNIDPLPPEADTSLPQTNSIYLSKKPGIKLSDQTGFIQAINETESITVRLFNDSESIAPYVWLSIDDIAGVNIQSVTHIASSVIFTPVAYPGGNMYKLNNIASSSYEEYKIDFTYTTCVQTDIKIEAGWNCSSYPTSPNEYICNREQIIASFLPLESEIEVILITEPSSSSVDLCETLFYQYNINNVQAGNAIDNIFTILPVQGIAPEVGSFEAEYPINSGNWEIVASTMVNGNYQYDLTTHSAYPIQGLPGTLSNNSHREISVRFNMETSCDFVSGTAFKVEGDAKSTCGSPSIKGSSVEIPPISIAGTESYSISNNLSVFSGDFQNCDSVTISGSAIVISSSPINSGEITITLPVGYIYNESSFICTSTYCPTATQFETDVSGNSVLHLEMPGIMTGGDDLSYTIEVLDDPDSNSNNGTQFIAVSSIYEIGDLTCQGNGTCSSVDVLTGDFSLEINTEKIIPVLNNPNNVTSCNTDTIPDIAFTSDVVGTTYTWTNDDETIGLAASGTGNIASFTATNTTTNPITATIIVNPTANGCQGDTKTFTITVNPTPVMDDPNDVISCNDDTIAAIAFTSDVAGTTYTWTNNNIAIGLANSGTG